MADADNFDYQPIFYHFVYDPIIPNSNAITLFRPNQFLYAWWVWICR